MRRRDIESIRRGHSELKEIGREGCKIGTHLGQIEIIDYGILIRLVSVRFCTRVVSITGIVFFFNNRVITTEYVVFEYVKDHRSYIRNLSSCEN